MDVGMAGLGQPLETLPRTRHADGAILHARGAGAVPGGAEMAYTTGNRNRVPQRVLPTMPRCWDSDHWVFQGGTGLGGTSMLDGFPPAALADSGRNILAPCTSGLGARFFRATPSRSRCGTTAAQ